MKRIFFIVLISLIACDNNSSQKIDIASISIDEFSVILEEVHVAEATYQLNKISDLKSAEKDLLQAYARIFKENNTTKSKSKRNPIKSLVNFFRKPITVFTNTIFNRSKLIPQNFVYFFR